MRFCRQTAITEALEDLNLSFPKVRAAQRKELAAARAALQAESACAAP